MWTYEYNQLLINSNKDITKVGVGFTFQDYKNLPIEPHDEKLDWILTEKYLYKIVSEFTTDKITFSDFEDEFNKLLFYIENSNKIIRKIIVSKDSNEIILSSS